MNGMFCQDMIMRWYTPLLMVLIMLIFCPFYVVFDIPALFVTMWVPVLMTISIINTGERMTHFGSYAVCSHTVSRRQFMNSKYACLITILVSSAVITAVFCLIFRNDPDLPMALVDILMTSVMCLFAFSSDLMMMFRNGFDDSYLPEAMIILTLAAVNVLILVFWPGEIVLILAVTAAVAVGTAVCWRRSCGYVEKMNF